MRDERVIEEQLRLVLIVRAASEFDVLRRRFTAHGKRAYVMELEEARLRTSPARSVKGAPSSITLPDLALYACRDVARIVTSDEQPSPK